MSSKVKFRCVKNQMTRGGCDLAFHAVPEENLESSKFFMYTPAGQITIYAVRPEIAEMFEVNKQYYFDICSVE